MSELSDLFRQHNTDKFTYHRYDRAYSWLLAELRDLPGLRLLEVGVAEGASLRAWEDYLPNAEIVGLDIDPECAPIEFKRARVVIGDSSDAYVLNTLGEFDIVIDDGCHRPQSQINTFRALWPRTSRLYVIEDLNMHSPPRFNGTLRWVTRRLMAEALKRGSDHPPMCHTIVAGQLLAFRKYNRD